MIEIVPHQTTQRRGTRYRSEIQVRTVDFVGSSRFAIDSNESNNMIENLSLELMTGSKYIQDLMFGISYNFQKKYEYNTYCVCEVNRVVLCRVVPTTMAARLEFGAKFSTSQSSGFLRIHQK